MELEINYILKDYIKANLVHYKSTRRIYFIVSLGFICLLFSLYSVIVSPSAIFAWSLLILSLFMATYPLTVIPLISRVYMKKQKYFDGSVKLNFSDNYIYSDNPLGESKLKWIHKIIIDKDILLIYSTPRNFIIIPLKYCKDADQFNDIIHYVKDMPGSGKIYELEKSKFSFYSFLLAIMNIFILIMTANALKEFYSVHEPFLKFLKLI